MTAGGGKMMRMRRDGWSTVTSVPRSRSKPVSTFPVTTTSERLVEPSRLFSYVTTSRRIVSLVTNLATARVCSTTTDWLMLVSPPVRRRNGAIPRATPRPTITASPKSSSERTSGQTGRLGVLLATARHGGFDLGDLPRRATQPLHPGPGDRVVVLD